MDLRPTSHHGILRESRSTSNVLSMFVFPLWMYVKNNSIITHPFNPRGSSSSSSSSRIFFFNCFRPFWAKHINEALGFPNHCRHPCPPGCGFQGQLRRYGLHSWFKWTAPGAHCAWWPHRLTVVRAPWWRMGCLYWWHEVLGLVSFPNPTIIIPYTKVQLAMYLSI